MPEHTAELDTFMTHYEQANNDRDIAQIASMIAENATYWFSDGSHRGLEEIVEAVERTFAVIRDETYAISDLQWVVASADTGVCRYRFAWHGLIDGEPHSGRGRGTNVLVRRDGLWKVQHEHLSP